MDTLLLVGKVLLAVFAFANIAFALYVNRSRLGFAWSVWKRVRVGMVLECICVIILTITSFLLLKVYVPLMGIGWANLFFENGGNVLIVPMTDATQSPNFFIRLLVPIFLVMFMVVIPFMTHIEENSFRKGYHQWGEIIRQSIKFGFIHMIVGIPLAGGVVLSGVGLFYALKYKRAFDRLEGKLSWSEREEEAVMVSTTYHAIYNALLITLLLVLALMLL